MILKTIDRIAGLVPEWLVLLAARWGIAAVFWQSARTKVSGLLTITPGTFELFASEYAGVPLPPVLAAHMATYAEHAFAVLLALGLMTRISAAGLLGMTAVIQIFVYPDAWPTHLSWAALLLLLIRSGSGAAGIDHGLRPAGRARPAG